MFYGCFCPICWVRLHLCLSLNDQRTQNNVQNEINACLSELTTHFWSNCWCLARQTPLCVHILKTGKKCSTRWHWRTLFLHLRWWITCSIIPLRPSTDALFVIMEQTCTWQQRHNPHYWAFFCIILYLKASVKFLLGERGWNYQDLLHAIQTRHLLWILSWALHSSPYSEQCSPAVPLPCSSRWSAAQAAQIWRSLALMWWCTRMWGIQNCVGRNLEIWRWAGCYRSLPL